MHYTHEQLPIHAVAQHGPERSKSVAVFYNRVFALSAFDNASRRWPESEITLFRFGAAVSASSSQLIAAAEAALQADDILVLRSFNQGKYRMLTPLIPTPSKTFGFEYRGQFVTAPVELSGAQITQGPEAFGFSATAIDATSHERLWFRRFALEDGQPAMMTVKQVGQAELSVKLPLEIGVYREDGQACLRWLQYLGEDEIPAPCGVTSLANFPLRANEAPQINARFI